MFDYQAGEKFKLTMIMIGFAGLMAGMLFTMILMPSQEAPRHAAARPKYMNDPDITGRRDDLGRSRDDQGRTSEGYSRVAPAAVTAASGGVPTAGEPAPGVPVADAQSSLGLVESWLPLAWDLSAGTAKADQAKAMAYMTPDCAQAYQQNIWTPELAQQIEQSGLKSTFNPKKVSAGQTNQDGSIVIFVEGDQVLEVPGKGARTRPVKTEYLVKRLPDGLRIAGISEGG